MWEKKDIKVKTPDVKQPEFKSSESFSSPLTRPPSPSFGVNEKLELVKVGKSIHIKGEISGNQDLVIEGRLEGKIELKDNQVTVGEHGSIAGEIQAREITIFGEVNGNMFAKDRLEIKGTGSLKGDIKAPRLTIEDGAHFKGTVEMEPKKQDAREEKPVSKFAAITLNENLEDPEI